MPPLDTPVAAACATPHGPDPVSERDGWIASAALAHGLIVVTRNVGDFETTGVVVLNPWEFR